MSKNRCFVRRSTTKGDSNNGYPRQEERMANEISRSGVLAAKLDRLRQERQAGA
jgi:hypothetical protein